MVGLAEEATEGPAIPSLVVVLDLASRAVEMDHVVVTGTVHRHAVAEAGLVMAVDGVNLSSTPLFLNLLLQC